MQQHFFFEMIVVRWIGAWLLFNGSQRPLSYLEVAQSDSGGISGAVTDSGILEMEVIMAAPNWYRLQVKLIGRLYLQTLPNDYSQPR